MKLEKLKNYYILTADKDSAIYDREEYNKALNKSNLWNTDIVYLPLNITNKYILDKYIEIKRGK